MRNSVGPDGQEAPKLRVVSSNENFEARRYDVRADLNQRARAVSYSYTSIGECVALRRRERGISQREFAFSLGIKTASLRDYENGETIFTPDLLLQAAQILEVQPAQFFMILAEKRLADLSAESFPIEANVSVAEGSDKIRLALLETISKCDSLITILDIIAVSKTD